jgi:hypothetical protein
MGKQERHPSDGGDGPSQGEDRPEEKFGREGGPGSRDDDSFPPEALPHVPMREFLERTPARLLAEAAVGAAGGAALSLAFPAAAGPRGVRPGRSVGRTFGPPADAGLRVSHLPGGPVWIGVGPARDAGRLLHCRRRWVLVEELLILGWSCSASGPWVMGWWPGPWMGGTSGSSPEDSSPDPEKRSAWTEGRSAG